MSRRNYGYGLSLMAAFSIALLLLRLAAASVGGEPGTAHVSVTLEKSK